MIRVYIDIKFCFWNFRSFKVLSFFVSTLPSYYLLSQLESETEGKVYTGYSSIKYHLRCTHV